MAIERPDHPAATHYAFPYFFSDVDGINWHTPIHEYDLSIYYDSEPYTFIDCRCSRWDSDNYQIILETWLKKSDLQLLIDNTTPGAVSELYNVLGKPFHYDKTWTADNTLRIVPVEESVSMRSSTLRAMRKPMVIFPKNITYSPMKGANQWNLVKIEGFISGNQDL
jgi:hypothetical protein